MLIPVILSGGSGTRLWPLSRTSFPKQFLPLFDEQSLFQKTVLRMQALPNATAPIIVCNHVHETLIKKQLADIQVQAKCIIVEPVGRNTAPAVALAALAALQDAEDPQLLVTPADHCVKENNLFIDSVRAVLSFADDKRLILFGLKPDAPRTEFGYICQGESIAPHLFRVARFVEKPPIEVAKQLIADKHYLWNSGIFLFRARSFLHELRVYEKEMAEICERAYRGSTRREAFMDVPQDIFSACKNISIDYAVFEKTTQAYVSPLSMPWVDVGNWDRILDVLEKDAAGNSTIGSVHLLKGARDCFAYTTSRALITVGVENLLIIETPDILLVANKEKFTHQLNEILKTVSEELEK